MSEITFAPPGVVETRSEYTYPVVAIASIGITVDHRTDRRGVAGGRAYSAGEVRRDKDFLVGVTERDPWHCLFEAVECAGLTGELEVSV